MPVPQNFQPRMGPGPSLTVHHTATFPLPLILFFGGGIYIQNFTGGQLLYCVMLVSVVAEGISHTYTYIPPFFWIPFPLRSPQSTE